MDYDGLGPVRAGWYTPRDLVDGLESELWGPAAKQPNKAFNAQSS